MNPKISAYSHFYGPHDYNAAPFVHVWMETPMHDKPKKKSTFAENCSKGSVLSTAFEHYWSWAMCIKDTRATRISDTVFHKHKYITNPDVTPKDRMIAAAGKLADKLKGRMPPHLS